jgi:ribonucleoside-diphosphate reductase beta chain
VDAGAELVFLFRGRQMSVFEAIFKNDEKLFFGTAVNITRFDKPKYQFLEKLTVSQLGFFWQPTEVDVYKDAKDFKSLSVYEQHIFTSNIKRQILLDSVQGRAPTLALSPICSSTELETWIQTWTFFETIHSRSYTHIIRNIYSNPSVVFDEMLDIQEIVECASDISKYYDDLIGWNIDYKHHRNNAGLMDIEYDHKKALWLALMSVNILEGIRFYVSFACSWAFAEMKKMEGNAKIIKLICRDENLHLAGTQQLLKVLPKDDEDFAKIKEETKSDCVQMYINAANQEKIWSEYLFKDGSMIGLNAKLLSDYVEWITNRRLVSVDLPTQFKTGSNPLPWTQKWISGGDVQVAPQETQISSYVSGGVAMDVNNDTLKTLSL